MRRGIQDFSLTVHDGLFDRVEWVPDAAAIATTSAASIGLCAADCCGRATCTNFDYEGTACKAHSAAGTLSVDAGHWYCVLTGAPPPPQPPPSPPPAPPGFFSAALLTDYHNTQKSCYNSAGVIPVNAADEWTGTKAEAEFRCAMHSGCVATHDYK